MRWLLIYSLISSQCFARVVLVKGFGTDLDYRAELKAHADLISPIEAHRLAHPSASARENLIAVFSEAQKAFLEKPAAEAGVALRRVIGCLREDDWAASDREIFLAAYLRLAQLGNADHWLRESLLLGEDVGFDSALYPPPLVERRAQLARQIAKGNPARELLSNDFPVVLIDGHECGANRCEDFPLVADEVRVTLLSNRGAAIAEVLELERVARIRPNLRPFASGECDSMHWTPEAEAFAERRLFAKCKTQKLVPVMAATPLLFTSAARPSEHVPFYKNKWLWIGVGVLAAGVAAVALTQKPHETVEPTTTYGYH